MKEIERDIYEKEQREGKEKVKSPIVAMVVRMLRIE